MQKIFLEKTGKTLSAIPLYIGRRGRGGKGLLSVSITPKAFINRGIQSPYNYESCYMINHLYVTCMSPVTTQAISNQYRHEPMTNSY